MSEAIKDFVLALEKNLATRRLYAPHMEPYQEAADRLLEKCRAAAADTGFTLRVGPTDVFLEKKSLLNRPKREDAFFFPLYRDGLRELTFGAEVAPRELEAFMKVLEAEEKRTLGPADDTVGLLWRSDLSTITYKAIDGIGDQEGDDGPDAGRDDFGPLVSQLTEQIKNPAPPSLGQRYAFVVDADVQVAGSDFHYEATTVRKAFEDNPTVHTLSLDEAAALRAEMGEERDARLIERFVEILLAILTAPGSPVSVAELLPVLQKLLEGHWSASDHAALEGLLARLRSASESAPTAETRAGAAELVATFFTPERVANLLERVEKGALAFAEAARIADHAGDQAFPGLVEVCARLPDGQAKTGLTGLLRSRLTSNPELLRPILASQEPSRVKVALTLLDRRLEAFYVTELLGLVSHPDEAIRLKGIAAAGRLGGTAALEALWKAMQSDPSKAARLYAFRTVAMSNLPGLPERLRRMVVEPGFATRPSWEREKYVRLLGAISGPASIPLFESWIPTKRWFWQPEDSEDAEVALRGLAACGAAGLEKVKALASGGRLADLAKKVVDSTKREMGETVMMRPDSPGSTPGPGTRK